MITYVNTVLVSNLSSENIASGLNGSNGQYIIVNADTNAPITTTAGISGVNRIKVGMFTGETTKDMDGNSRKVIRWSNIINRAGVKKFSVLNAYGVSNTEDSIVIDFSGVDAGLAAKWAKGGKRIIVRLTFKDLPTRFRKWTESYEYVTVATDLTDANNDGAELLAFKRSIATGIANLINKQVKRARVVATTDVTTANTAKLILTAMPYDDDNSAESINRFDKVRFNANIYWTDPAAEGAWDWHNKYFPNGVTVGKTPGFQYAASGKLVRDREQAALGYMGILNHGEGTWPIIQPAMRVDITANYNAVTLEFENMYHTADDLMRKTKQTVELYTLASVAMNGVGGVSSAQNTVAEILASFAGDAYQPADTETEDFA